MARPLVMTLTTIYCCQLPQTMMPNRNQRGELTTLLPRHQRGMCMPMTLLTMRKISSMMLTIWIVTLWTFKPMCTSRIPRILYLLETEHSKNHVLLHLIGMEHSQKHLSSQQWHSLQPEARATWDLLSDEAYHFKPTQGSWEAHCQSPQHQCIRFSASRHA